MGIIHQRNKKTGKILVYETSTEIDPETGKKHIKRKSLGTEENGVLVPSSGKRGRRPLENSQPRPVISNPGPADIAAQEAELARMEREEKALREEIEQLSKQLESFNNAFSGILEALSEFLDESQE